jgi:hypothetical protein
MNTINNLYDRLVEEKDRLGAIALRTPKTAQELLARDRYERVMKILWRRYDYGIDDVMEEYRAQDHIDEVIEIERRTNGKN